LTSFEKGYLKSHSPRIIFVEGSFCAFRRPSYSADLRRRSQTSFGREGETNVTSDAE